MSTRDRRRGEETTTKKRMKNKKQQPNLVYMLDYTQKKEQQLQLYSPNANEIHTLKIFDLTTILAYAGAERESERARDISNSAQQ